MTEITLLAGALLVVLFVIIVVVGHVGRRMQQEATRVARESREEMATTIHRFGELMATQISLSGEGQMRQLESYAQRQAEKSEEMWRQIENMRAAVDEKLRLLQEENTKQLEEMRKTVDEKLQGTLEKRLGESFRQVSERLEQVHKGLGEMHGLAQGVGDLKKVLSNVKVRGTWGEMQLGTLLEQVLSPDQYVKNFAPREGGERVEYAIRLPGQGVSRAEAVFLPVDAKFPLEDYQRLLEAQERGDAGAAEEAGKQLENRVKSCAKDIYQRYLAPPKTTDFAILYLPIEGLFAEIIRRPELVEKIQREYRVVMAGPTTFWALLSSLQMGFRTLAVEQRSSEVWRLLAEVKKEWEKYGDILDKVQTQLRQASDSIDKARRQTQVIGQKLVRVEELPPSATGDGD